MYILNIGGESKRREKNTSKAKTVFIMGLRTCRNCHWDCWFPWQGGESESEWKDGGLCLLFIYL